MYMDDNELRAGTGPDLCSSRGRAWCVVVLCVFHALLLGGRNGNGGISTASIFFAYNQRNLTDKKDVGNGRENLNI